MNFKIKINNIGKLKDVDISLRPFTILSGPNNTGKSFVSKVLYSMFGATGDPLLTYIQNHLNPLKINLHRIQQHFEFYDAVLERRKDKSQNNDKIKILTNRLKEAFLNIRKLEDMTTPFNLSENADDFNQQIIKYLNAIMKSCDNILSFCSPFAKASANKKIPSSLFSIKGIEYFVRDLKKSLERLGEIKKESDMTVNAAIKLIENNLKGNFQISILRELTGDPKKSAEITFQNEEESQENKIKIIISENEIQSNSSILKLVLLQNSFRAIYLESPIYWKLRNALTRASRRPSYMARQSLLIPKYFEDLNFMLMDELSGKVAFPEILENLNQKTIEGKLVIDESEAFKFKENTGKIHSLPSTATGIVQFGILALLIEKKALDKQTILFIDEPELNLHPAWQIKMMEVLFQLVKQGAFVVMATHSSDMLKWLEVQLKNEPSAKNLVALNQMNLQEDGLASSVKMKKDIQNQIRAIKKNLTKPYLRLFLEGQE